MRHKQLADRVAFIKENREKVRKISSSIVAKYFKEEIAEAATKRKLKVKKKL